MPCDWSSIVRFITQLMVMLKSIADIVQPCLRPVFTSNLVLLLCTLYVNFAVEAFDDVDNLLWYTVSLKDVPQTFLVHAVKSLLIIYKVDVELFLPLCALLYDVAQGEDLVCASLSFPKSCPLSSQLLVHCVGYSLDDDLCQDLARYR